MIGQEQAGPGCDGLCVTASDLGVSVPGDPVANPHPGCPLHDPDGECGCGNPDRCLSPSHGQVTMAKALEIRHRQERPSTGEEDEIERKLRAPGQPASEKTHLTEYSEQKSEQRDLIRDRDGLLYATFTVLTGVLVAAFTAKRPEILLVGPPVILVLGWTYLRKDIMISKIGRYVREELAPLLGENAFGWDRYDDPPAERRLRKRCQLAADLISFPLSASGLALAGVFMSPRGSGLVLGIAAMAEVIAAYVLAALFARHFADELKPKADR